MEECDQLAARAFERHLVQQPHAGRLRLAELAADIVGGERDVMDAFPVVLEETRHRAVRRRRLEQLEVHVADGEERGPHFLRGHFLAVLALEAQRLLVIRNRFVQGANRDSKVIDACDHGRESNE